MNATLSPEGKPEKLYTLVEIQAAAGVSRPTLYRWRHEHGLKMVQVGGCVRIREQDWLEFLSRYGSKGNGNATRGVGNET